MMTGWILPVDAEACLAPAGFGGLPWLGFTVRFISHFFGRANPAVRDQTLNVNSCALKGLAGQSLACFGWLKTSAGPESAQPQRR
jgi:hypothetical protein